MNYDQWKTETPPEAFENECKYCGEECSSTYCSNQCKKAYEQEN